MLDNLPFKYLNIWIVNSRFKVVFFFNSSYKAYFAKLFVMLLFGASLNFSPCIEEFKGKMITDLHCTTLNGQSIRFWYLQR